MMNVPGRIHTNFMPMLFVKNLGGSSLSLGLERRHGLPEQQPG